MPHTRGRESPGSNVIILCILWKWWARKGLNLGPRDYECHGLVIYASRSLRIPNVFRRSLCLTTETEPMPNLVAGDSERVASKPKKRKGFRKPNTELLPNRISERRLPGASRTFGCKEKSGARRGLTPVFLVSAINEFTHSRHLPSNSFIV
jgi:hypothetical protein